MTSLSLSMMIFAVCCLLSICSGTIRLGSLLSACAATPQQQAAILLALRDINNKTDGRYDYILPHDELLMAMRIVEADVHDVMQSTKELANQVFAGQGVTAIIGPDSPGTTQGNISAFYSLTQPLLVSRLVLNTYDIPQLHYALSTASFSEGIYYPHFMRVAASDAMQGHPLVELLEYFKWKNVFVVFTVDAEWRHVQYNFVSTAQEHGIDILGSVGITRTDDIERAVYAIRKAHARIIVLLTSAAHGVEVIKKGCELNIFKQGMQLIGSDVIASPDSPIFQLPLLQRAKLLTGYIGVQQRIALSEEAEHDFIARWRSQPPTRIDHNDGTVWCSNATDDDGQFIYYDPASPQNCSGLDFRLFSTDGSDIHPSAILAYDATISLALALHHTQTQNKLLNLENIYNAVINLNFNGISGKICFSDEFSSSLYGLGDRHCGVHYEVVQYHADHDEFEFVAEWSSDDGYFHCSDDIASHHGHDCEELVFNNKDPSQPPPDGPSAEHEHVEEGFEIALSIASVVGMCGIVVVVYVYIAYSKRFIIRLSQPVLCFVILVGVLCGCLRVLIAQFHKTEGLCSASLWLSHMCFVIIYTTLVVKTWKVHRVMNSGMKKVRISTRFTLLLTLCLIIIPVLLMLVIQFSSPPVVGKVVIVSNQEEKLIDEYCAFGRYSVVDDVLYAYEGLLIIYGAYLIYVTRRIPAGVSDSSKLRQMMVTVLVLCGSGAVTFLFDMHPHMRDFIVSMLFAVGVLRCLYLLFGEIVCRTLAGYDIKDDFVSYVRVSHNKYSQRSARGIVPINRILTRGESKEFETIRHGTMTEKQALEEIRAHEARLRLLQNYLLSLQSDKSAGNSNSLNSNSIGAQVGQTAEAGESVKDCIDTDASTPMNL